MIFKRAVVLALLTVTILSVPSVSLAGKKDIEPIEVLQGFQEQAIINMYVDLANIEAIAAYLAAEAEKVRLEQERLAEIERQRNLISVDWARWLRLHQCEQGNTWYANGGNPADPSRQVFQGGLGMSTVAWQMAVRAAAARGVYLPSSALSATPEQQMIGAQAFYDAYGWGWSCRV